MTKPDATGAGPGHMAGREPHDANREGALNAAVALPPTNRLEELRVALEHLRDDGYQPGYNGRPSCPFCLNFIDEEEGHRKGCALVYALEPSR